jgi:hypothetical protein|tara:strand:- start:1123 stop:1356 length:234 start_codon:yes stop_codon:yes gene_type:complete
MSRTGKPVGRPKKENTLLQEAKEFRESKLPKEKPLTARLYLAGQALAGLLAGRQGSGRSDEVKREAYGWADRMLDDD